MSIEKITGEEYSVEYNGNTKTVTFIGSMRLRTSEEYAPINNLLMQVHDVTDTEGTLILDFSELKFLNSSGINVISRFVIAARKEAMINLQVNGSQQIYWQKKSLTNLKRLWSKVKIDIQ
ncbi:MAG: hypothetical protein GY805_03850 [Chloroflexi bacterium]|nr:hypothetical protein [Chloroflexota bacterium]